MLVPVHVGKGIAANRNQRHGVQSCTPHSGVTPFTIWLFSGSFQY